MAWLLVTPSSRGIGFALTRQLLQSTPSSVPIVATTRGDKKQLHEQLLADLKLDDSDKAKARLDIQSCDLLAESSIKDLSAYCKDRYQPGSKGNAGSSKGSDNGQPHLRLAFMVPGKLHPEKSPAQIDYDDALSTLQLNLLAPMMLLKHFHGFLPRKNAQLPGLEGLPPASVMAFMSARVGSITDNKLGGWFSYRASKAGLNQMVRTADNATRVNSGDKACVVGLHPGTVKTDLSKEFWGNVKEDKLFSPEYSAERLCEVVTKVGESLDGEDRMGGRCWDWAGKEVPP